MFLPVLFLLINYPQCPVELLQVKCNNLPGISKMELLSLFNDQAFALKDLYLG